MQSQVKGLNINIEERNPMKDVGQASDLHFERLFYGSCYVKNGLRGQNDNVAGN